MSTIKQIQHVENKGTYLRVHVLMADGTEAQVFVGGECEVYLDHGVVKAFVKKKKG